MVTKTKESAAATRAAFGTRRARWWNRRAVLVVAIAAMAIVGPILMLAFSDHGVHTSNDSFSYLGAAHNLAHGRGWTYPFGDIGAPVTLFPPLYPLLLAVPNVLHLDVLHWVLWQNAILSGVLAAVAGCAVGSVTGWSIWSIAATIGLTALGRPPIFMYSRAWSETLFLPLEVGALWFLSRFLVARKPRDLVIATALSSLALLTRYAGLSILLTGCLLVAVWPGRRLILRLRDLGVYAVGSLALSAAWALRNQLESQTLTGNNHLVHTLHGSQIREGVRTIRLWFFPDGLPGRFGLELLVVALAGVLLALVLGRLVRRLPRWRIRVPALAVVCLSFVVVHFVFLAAANAFSTRQPPFNDRILGLAYVPLVIGVIVVVYAVSAEAPRVVRALGVLTAAALLAVAAVSSPPLLRDRYRTPVLSGDALASMSASLRPYGAGGAVFSNQSNVAWFLLNRPVVGLPRSCLGSGHTPDPRFGAKLRALGRTVTGERRIVLVFKSSRRCSPFSLAAIGAALHVRQQHQVGHVVVFRGS
jgi:hypothetical protein